jgi:hypothetical protein
MNQVERKRLKRKRKLAERREHQDQWGRDQQAQLDRVIAGRSAQESAALAKRLHEIRKPARVHELAPDGIYWQDRRYDDLLLRQGKVISPSIIRSINGQPGLCNENCAALFWVHHPKYKVATGYVYQNGMWCRHTWLMEGEAIIETTSERDVYFGVILEDLDEAGMVLNSLLSILQECGLGIHADPGGQTLTLRMPAA